MKNNCIMCGQEILNNDTIGVNKKILGRNIENFYCMDCFADYLECDVEELLERIEEFKDGGCTLFN